MWTAGAEWELPWLLRCHLSLTELGLKYRAFIFHFLSFCFPLYINTVGILEKNKKITWDFLVQSSAPLLLLFMNSSLFSDFTIAAQYFHSALRIPELHRFCCTQGAQGVLCISFAGLSLCLRGWRSLATAAVPAWSKRCLPEGSCVLLLNVLLLNVLPSVVLGRFFWNVDMLSVWYNPSQTRQTQGKCPPHQLRPALFLFPLVLTQKYEVEVLGISTCQSLMVFLLLSWFVFHCLPISVQGLLCLHHFFCCLSFCFPAFFCDWKKNSKRWGDNCVISGNFSRFFSAMCWAITTPIEFSGDGKPRALPSQRVLCTCQNRAQRNHIYSKLFWMAAVKQLERANALASGSNFTCL